MLDPGWIRVGGLVALVVFSPAAGRCLASSPIGSDAAVVLPEPLSDADFVATDPLQVELGKLLFHDKILSGNRNISCATCHHALADTGDGLSLSVGEGGCGLGVTRDTGFRRQAIVERVPRNAPPVFNLGARDVRVMFHDGRLEPDPDQPSGFSSPAGADLPFGLDGVQAAQAMFPVTSPAEMAGQPGENRVADAAADGDLPRVWDLLSARVRRNREYVALFRAAFDEVETRRDITFVQVANAIAAFEIAAWKAADTPFDRYLRGDSSALNDSALSGMALFYGKADCGSCHSGRLLTDQEYHAVAMPQIGPGKGDGPDGHGDFGRERVTGDPDDRFRFRTPPLRNVALTGPWGHAGAYDSLEATVRHLLAPEESIANYDSSQAVLPHRRDLDRLDFVVQDDPDRVAYIASHNECSLPPLNDTEVDDLVSFLHALTDPASLDLRRSVPRRVPSGLPLAECVVPVPGSGNAAYPGRRRR